MLIHLKVHWGANLFITSSSGACPAHTQDGKTQRIKTLPNAAFVEPAHTLRSDKAICLEEWFPLQSGGDRRINLGLNYLSLRERKNLLFGSLMEQFASNFPISNTVSAANV